MLHSSSVKTNGLWISVSSAKLFICSLRRPDGNLRNDALQLSFLQVCLPVVYFCHDPEQVVRFRLCGFVRMIKLHEWLSPREQVAFEPDGRTVESLTEFRGTYVFPIRGHCVLKQRFGKPVSEDKEALRCTVRLVALSVWNPGREPVTTIRSKLIDVHWC
ncbi:hypothetical protein PHSY_005840 [Pseudozyma hubeiensis SY62]|uniref:Uncharacterized protein n=1 Tax=Pseudozyma hubeiensis (strain SY62) TaxID=1305764 RepID=R9PA58_PSEHS|nr:hypothetical protein PHSY_005840 [Pseudozyma hubeiensis SY62]GAC98251.1 hypothetical protein PHSY_005840 [Pseudozyma hubeiensis SY62]